MKHRGVRSHYCFHFPFANRTIPLTWITQPAILKPGSKQTCKDHFLQTSGASQDKRLADLKAPPAWTGQIGKSCRSWWSLHCRTPQGLCWPPGSAAAPMSRCLPSRWGVESGEADFTFKVHRGNLPECDLSSYLHQISKKDWEIK